MLENKDTEIRHFFDEKTDNWYFSIVDVISIITKSSDPRNYWKVFKNRLKKGQNQLVTQCNQLKMIANDGKSYLTDTGNEETILEIIKLISPEYIPQFKLYFNNLNHDVGPKVIYTNDPSDLSDCNKNESYPQEYGKLLIDGYQTNDQIIIKAMIGGISAQDISLFTNGKILTIKGERTKTFNLLNQKYIYEEIYWGNFFRSIVLPSEIETKKIITNCNNQILTIKLKKIKKVFV